ncbi:AsmA-like C-terminal region [Singulisphaera sp. GP187]|uniref:AsmA-like C-terminal region-containing protein n=1 Tax=Singulisphaera sp. GP187 TaxID=1882752 RepID=UPI00092B86EA|nr:AsmA-like C-terminal region-containing protein [Singulisphaera sp. GP187]SIO31147.1 AsmA-like C-terminal region [Singulisphaera sp. GP187]
MLTRHRVCKALFWGTFLLLTCMGGVIGFAFWYVTDSETVAALIQSQGKRFLPGSDVNVGRARIRPFLGEINLTHLQINQTLNGAPFQTLRFPWARIGYNARAMLKGKFEPREVVIAQPTLRLKQRKDGTWNLQGLLADPWPGPMMKTPPIRIQNGTVELIDGDVTRSPVILRDVAIDIKSPGGKLLEFEGSAKGDAFSRLALKGTIDLATGKLSLGGDVSRLAISATLRSRLPAELRSAFEQVGMTGGEIDLRVGQVSYDPTANPLIRYDVGIQIRSGVWDCAHLPFTINDVAANLSARDGVIRIDQATGANGRTKFTIEESLIVLGDPERAPLSLLLRVDELELDKRLRAWTPSEFLPLWKDFSPSGRIKAAVHLVREREGGPLGFGWTVDCIDASMIYRFFKYPLDHIRGRLVCENNQIRVNLQTLVGGKPLKATGTIDNPGDDAHVKLHFEGEAMPIDQALFDAMPPEINKVVGEFHPTGSVRGKADVERTRRTSPDDPPEGKVTVDAFLSLNENCSIRWDGLPYPVSNLTGDLELHPDKWIFRKMKGRNGQAEITGSGDVEKLPGPGPGDRLAVKLKMRAEKLPFDEQLYDALPPAWRKSWETLNPNGSSNVEAEILVHPDRREQYHLVIDPRPETAVQLKFGPPRQPGGKDTSGIYSLRMDKVKGRFVSDNGVVKMEDVGFMFYGSPVKFASGQVLVADSGQFKLNVEQVTVEKLRLDHEELVTIMPPVMKDFARRLDQGRPIAKINGDLGLSWSGRPQDSVLCDWKNVLVVLNDNTIQAGIPLEHLQGQLDNVHGRFDGQSLEVGGALNLASVRVLGQQITSLESPFTVHHGKAELTNIRGKLLGGVVSGRFGVTLDATPQYETELVVQEADLLRYAETLSGHQTYRGLVSGQLSLNGMGNDLKTLQGHGEAHVVRGNLGELPLVFQLVNDLKRLKFSPGNKDALFDSADVAWNIENGDSRLDAIKLTGNVISFKGRGTMDVQGRLNLALNPLAGRDRFHVPFLSDAIREASGQLFVVSVRGPLASPKFEFTALPRVADSVRSISVGKGRNSREESDVR